MNKTKNIQSKICDECKGLIEDDHEHLFETWNNKKVPACHYCYAHLVGCEIYIPDQWVGLD
jgi:hypothetical protein